MYSFIYLAIVCIHLFIHLSTYSSFHATLRFLNKNAKVQYLLHC